MSEESGREFLIEELADMGYSEEEIDLFLEECAE